MIRQSDRVKNMQPHGLREIASLAKQLAEQRSVIDLTIGDPDRYDFDTPAHLIAAMEAAINGRKNFYADSLGIDEARWAVANHYQNKGIDVQKDGVFITSGVAEGINLITAALVNTGDNVLIPRPSYSVYDAFIDLYRGEKRFYSLDEENRWNPDTGDLEKNIDKRTKLIVLINPNNPTGAVFGRKKIEEIVNLAGQHNIPILSDEIYSDMILEGEMVHPAKLADDVPVITTSGLAKSFLAPGWRVGWLAFSNNEEFGELQTAITKLCRARIGVATPQQYAVKPALETQSDHMKQTLVKLRKRRDLVFRRLNEIPGFSLVKPEAAFYAFPKIDVADDKAFILELLDKEGVAIVHGSAFDSPGHARLVYLAKEEILYDACDKIERFMKARK